MPADGRLRTAEEVVLRVRGAWTGSVTVQLEADSVSDLISRLASLSGLPAVGITLLIRGNKLVGGDRALSDYGVTASTTVHCLCDSGAPPLPALDEPQPCLGGCGFYG